MSRADPPSSASRTGDANAGLSGSSGSEYSDDDDYGQDNNKNITRQGKEFKNRMKTDGKEKWVVSKIVSEAHRR